MPPANSPQKGEGRVTNGESDKANKKAEVKAQPSDKKIEVKTESFDEKIEVKTESSNGKAEVKAGCTRTGLVRKCFVSEDLCTKPEAYTRSKILEFEDEVKSLEGSTSRRDQSRLCKLKYFLKIFKNKK